MTESQYLEELNRLSLEIDLLKKERDYWHSRTLGESLAKQKAEWKLKEVQKVADEALYMLSMGN